MLLSLDWRGGKLNIPFLIEETVKKLLLALLLFAVAACNSHAQTSADPSIVWLDPALDALLAPDAKLELVKNDFGFTEGIIWVDQGKSGYLLLSDMYANVIYKVTPEGKVSLYLDPQRLHRL